MKTKTLVIYFSAQGTTAKIAKELAANINVDLFEIKPEKPYSPADIKWINPMACCNREKFGNKDVPVSGRLENLSEYDTVLLGFPIWYGCAPNIVNTFCKDYDWNGVKVYAFATSGASGIGKTADKLAPYLKGAASIEAKLVKNAKEVENWIIA